MCRCRWLPDEREVVCFNGAVRCPAEVTPTYLEEAKGQGVCADERDKFYCNVVCTADQTVNWVASVCPNDGVSPCPPWRRTVIPQYQPNRPPRPASALHGPDVQPSPQPAAEEPRAPPTLRRDFSGASLLAMAKPEDAALVVKAGGFDLRGIHVRRRVVGDVCDAVLRQ